MKLAILGGGGFRVPLVHGALVRDPNSPITQLTLYDPDPVRLAAIGHVLDQAPSAGTTGKALPRRHTGDVREAVTDADFVFSAIRVGGLAGRVTDERVAIANDVLGQETVGAGGTAFGLRTIPVALDLAQSIRSFAPTAWVVNFTNPAGMVTEAMAQVLGDRVIGICDSPLGLARRVARSMGERIEDCRIDYAGLNHLGWLQGLHAAGGDLLPSFLADDAAIGGTEEGQIFGADWLRTLRAIPNEYLHYYYLHREALAAQHAGGHRTRGEFLHGQQQGFFDALSADPADARQSWESVLAERNATYMTAARGSDSARHEEDLISGGYEGVALALMRALAGGAPADLILNIRAGAQVGLPPDAVVEVPCQVTEGQVKALPTTALSLHMRGLVEAVKAVERHTISAAVTGSTREAVAAFALHPLIDSVTTARALVRDYRHAIPAIGALLTNSPQNPNQR